MKPSFEVGGQCRHLLQQTGECGICFHTFLVISGLIIGNEFFEPLKHSLVLVVFAHAVVAMIEIVSIELVLRTTTITYWQNLAGEAGLVGIFHLHASGILLVPHHFAIGLEATFASRLLEVAGRAFEEQAVVVHHEVVLMISIAVVTVANVVGLHGKPSLAYCALSSATASVRSFCS